MRINKSLKSFLLSLIVILSLTDNVFAESTVSEENQYIFNTLGFYLGGVLVAFMAAGFCMLEAGSVRSKNTAVICLKNIGLFSIAGHMLCIFKSGFEFPADFLILENSSILFLMTSNFIGALIFS